MLTHLRWTIGAWLLSDTIDSEQEITRRVNQRVASFIATMDPFEPLMRSFNCIFTDDFERSEDGLNALEQLRLKNWAYGTRDDASFKHLIQWMINSQGNAALKKGNPTPETILYSRAMLAAPVLMQKEVRRLAQLYEELVAGKDSFDPYTVTE